MNNDVVIVAALRTPTGRFQGEMGALSAVQLGVTVVQALLAQSGVPADAVDEVIMGQVLTAGCGQNPARQTALNAGLGVSVSAVTVNHVCGSGLKAVQLAAQSIQSGAAEIVIAGGQECMSQAPYLLSGARQGMRFGHGKVTDSLLHDGLWDAFNDYAMGITAENLAQKYAIDREAQDRFAAASQQKARHAVESGRFCAEIVPVKLPQKKGDERYLAEDEQPRPDTSLDSLAVLRPAFLDDGTVTAGNASTLNDGAAAVMLMRRERAQALGLPIMATLVASATAGVDPAYMGIGPVAATRRCLQRAGWSVASLDLIEANEAFASQSLAVNREMGWQAERVNVNGGAIALGHAIGASGCRILVTLLHEMQRRNVSRGLATLCVGGGQGIALAVARDVNAIIS
ncbi:MULTISPECIES: acetyl-CoA C-acetyltransferase [unclassified Leclercia]|uniref:Acetyl-CoA C-acetyltransferase n=1 Tax=Leclercia barmai TaxID=2785629 RepID=A0ABS7S1A0_9ENTR|nr:MULTISPECIES: acetyl-CoA C-acetyltransferase [unclassified Leclercia]MBZ0059509.1 acetyl-CoA C-acetyltransferase [Leclercia sp. EMC7]MCM5697359.1 acetyl-CoA C-acetyltransferase [Leclercia sp. LTM01]MCM5702046.1 acetyl-CoA C-acetyltransferase [Leclercia sp. LTM14]